jgi:hypothetical protein
MKTKCLMKFLNVTVLSLCCGFLLITCRSIPKEQESYPVRRAMIQIDGNTVDWASITPNTVRGKDHLWTDESLPAESWNGNEDLSFAWRVAWEGQKIFFLFEVRDDVISDFSQEFTWMNDCIEIHMDPENREGGRIEGIDENSPLEGRLGRKSYGYEMHFMPDQPPRVYLDDTKTVFYTDSLQNEVFRDDWEGEAVTVYTDQGYLMEIGFRVPAVVLESGKILGMDFAVCDDDGNGRENLMVWSGYEGPFWITMDYFNKMVLE